MFAQYFIGFSRTGKFAVLVPATAIEVQICTSLSGTTPRHIRNLITYCRGLYLVIGFAVRSLWASCSPVRVSNPNKAPHSALKPPPQAPTACLTQTRTTRAAAGAVASQSAFSARSAMPATRPHCVSKPAPQAPLRAVYGRSAMQTDRHPGLDFKRRARMLCLPLPEIRNKNQKWPYKNQKRPKKQNGNLDICCWLNPVFALVTAMFNFLFPPCSTCSPIMASMA